MSKKAKARRIAIRKLRRDYGLSVIDLARAAKKIGYAETMEPEFAATAIALQVCEDPDIRERVEGLGEIDWEKFFQGLIELVEVLLPLIMQIISLFL